MSCPLQVAVSEFYDPNTKVFDLGSAGSLSPDIDALLSMTAVFPPGTDYTLTCQDDASIECSLARFRGTSALPFPIAGNQQMFAFELLFFLDEDGAIQLTLTFTLQGTQGGLNFYLSDHFPKIDEVLRGIQFYWADYAIVSQARVEYQGIVLSRGANLQSAVWLPTQSRTDSPGTNPYTAVNWIWEAGKTTRLNYGGGFTPPTDPNTDPVAKLQWTSPGSPTGIEIGSVSFDAEAIATESPLQTANGAGVRMPLNLGGDLSDLVLQAVYDKPTPVTLALMVTTPPGTEQPNIDAFAQLLNGTSFGAVVPDTFPLGDRITLDLIELDAQLQLTTITAFKLGLGLKIGWELVPQIATLTKAGVRFAISNPTSANFDLGIALSATMALSDGVSDPVPFVIRGAPPSLRSTNNNWIIQGNLVSDTPTLDLFGVAAQLFPGVEAPDNPLFLEKLTFTFLPNQRTFSLDVSVVPGDGWTLPLDITITQIEASVRQTTNGMAVSASSTLTWLTAAWRISLGYDGRGSVASWTFGLMLLDQLPLSDLVDDVFANWDISLPGGSTMLTAEREEEELSALVLNSLALSIVLNTGAFRFNAGFAWYFPLLGTQNSIAAVLDIQRTSASNQDKGELSGSIRGDIDLLGLTFVAIFDFAPNTKQITFEFQQIVAVYAVKPVKPSGPPHQLLTIAFGDRSLGEMLANLISVADPGATTQLTGPWSFLNDINLNGLMISADFTAQIYRVTYRVDRSFPLIYLDTIGIEYNKQYGKGKLKLILEGTFFGTSYSGDNALSWDPVNEAPPSAPGTGNGTFELRYLAIGQHVAVRDAREMTSVEQVMRALRNNAYDVDNDGSNPLSQLPGLQFDASSHWLLGTEFVIKNMVTVDMVFNDPEVYGLLITAGGPSAGSLKGLRFEILYRKITDSIGLWHIDLNLPKAMRKLQMGSVTITMPMFTVDIYTNGDFAIDIGFPSSPTDYTRCFALEYFPFIGFGGFYFAKLSSETATQVPSITNGRFDPVIAFGIAMAVGLGKTLELGILSGGIYITVTGIIEGVYGRFLPLDTARDEATYLSLTGTIAIVGRVYATVDFAVIKASVDLTAYAMVTLRMASYEPMFIALEAGVRVSVSLKILFVKVRFSFSATIREEFTIGSYQPTPWVIGDPNTADGLIARPERLQHRTWKARRRAQRHWLRHAARPGPVVCAARDEGIQTIEVWATPVVTKALTTDLSPPIQGEEAPGQPEDTVALGMLFFAPAAADEADTVDALRASTAPIPAHGVEQLMRRLFLWMCELQGVTDSISQDQLDAIFDNLQRPEFVEEHFAYGPLGSWLQDNLYIDLQPRPTTGSGDDDTPRAAAFFPPIPELKLTAGDHSWDFGVNGAITDAYRTQLTAYFQALQVDYANAVERDPSGKGTREPIRLSTDDDSRGDTTAGWLFTQFFVAVTRSAIGVGQQELAVYHLTMNSSEPARDPAVASLSDIAGWFDTAEHEVQFLPGESHAGAAARLGVPLATVRSALAEGDGKVPVEVTPYAIVEGNQDRAGLLRVWPATSPPLSAERPSFSGVRYRVQATDILGPTDGQTDPDAIDQRFGVSLSDLVARNQSRAGSFSLGALLHAGDLERTPRDGDTLQKVAAYYEVDPATLDQVPLAGQALLLQDNETAAVTAGQTLKQVSDQLQVAIEQLLLLNPQLDVQVGDGVPAIQLQGVAHTCTGTTWTLPYIWQESDTLDSVVAFFEPNPALRPELAHTIETANPQFAFDDSGEPSGDPGNPVPPGQGDVVAIPYVETWQHVALAFLGTADVSGLLVDGNTTQVGLLAATSTLDIPTFELTVKDSTTFASLSTQYGLSLEDLAARLADVPGLFRDTEVGTDLPIVVQVEDVPAEPLDRFLQHLMDSMRFTEAAGQFSRFMLQGLRVPAPGDSRLEGLAASPLTEDASALDTWPLYAITGQEFAPPAPDPGISVLLDNVGGATWVTAVQTSVALTDAELGQITDYGSTPLDLSSAVFTAMDLAQVVPAQTALGNPRPYQAAELPASVVDPSGRAGDPSVWAVPVALQETLADEGQPFGLYAIRRSAAGDKAQAIEHFAWATLITMGVQTAGIQFSTASDNVGPYPLAGANDADKQRLFALWDHLARTGAGCTVSVLYTTNPGGDTPGYGSDALDRNGSTLLQTNLSTQSNPLQGPTADLEAATTIAFVDAGEPLWTTLDNDQVIAILKLLWRASVTHSGGFYLDYKNTDGEGLPDWVFDQEGRGEIQFLFTVDSQTPGALAQDAFPEGSAYARLYPFNNVALVGDPVDTTQQQLVAEVALVGVGEHKTPAASTAAHTVCFDSLEHLARAQARVPNLLRKGITVQLGQGREEPVRHGDSWQTIASRTGLSVAELVAANADAPVYREGAWHASGDGLIQIKATQPAGSAGFELTRAASGTFSGTQESLQELFNLAGFAVRSSDAFRPSGEGLPVGPTELTDQGPPTAAALARLADDPTTWDYATLLRLSLLANQRSPDLSPALPPGLQDPYAGIGLYGTTPALGNAVVGLAIQDVLGNRSVASSELGTVDVPWGYTDVLLSVDSWPSVHAVYAFTGTGDPTLGMDLSFSAERYLPADGVSWNTSHDSARVDRERILTAHYQVWRSDVRFALDSTMGAVGDPGDAGDAQQRLWLASVRDLDIAVYVFLTEAVRAGALVRATDGAGTWGRFATDHGTTPGSLAAGNPSEKAGGLFAAGQLLNNPSFYAARDQDQLGVIASTTGASLSDLATQNETLGLQAGIAVTIGDTAVSLEEGPEVGVVAADNHAAMADGTGGVVGFVGANQAAVDVGQTIRYGAHSIESQAGETFQDLARRLVVLGEPSATAAAVATTNPTTRYAASSASLIIANRVLQATDTLKSLGELTGWGSAEFANRNQAVQGLFPSGTALLIRVDTWDPNRAAAAELTLQETADAFALSLDEFGEWQAEVRLADGRSLAIPGLVDASDTVYGTYRYVAGGTFDAILDAPVAGGMHSASFLANNKDLPGLFTPGKTLPVEPVVVTDLDTTFASVAAATSMTLDQVWDAVCGVAGLPRPGAAAVVPTLQGAAGAALESLASGTNATLSEVGDANAATFGLITSGTATVTFPDGTTLQEPIGPYDSLGLVAARMNQTLVDVGSDYTVSAALVAAQNGTLAIGTVPVLPPVGTSHVSGAVATESSLALLPVRVTATLTRDSDLVQNEFKTEPTVQEAGFQVTAAALEDAQGHDVSNDAVTLRNFAIAFERAFTGFKLATGTDRGQGTPTQRLACGTNLSGVRAEAAAGTTTDQDPGPQIQLWAARFGQGTDPHFAIDARPDDIAFYGIAPLSTTLWTSPKKIEVYPYSSESGLGEPDKVLVQAIDVVDAMGTMLSAIDSVLTPVASSRLLGIQRSGGSGYYDAFTSRKQVLADYLSADVELVLQAAPAGDAEAAREAVRQAMLVELGAGYAVNTVVQAPFDVTSPCGDPKTAARLLGTPTPRFPSTPNTAGTGQGYGIQAFADDLRVDASYLIGVIELQGYILQVGNIVESLADPRLQHTVTSTDTLTSVAAALDLDSPSDLLDQVRFVQGDGLLGSGTTVSITPSLATPQVSPTVSQMALTLDATLGTLLTANQDQLLFAPDTSITLAGDTQTVPASGTPNAVLGQFTGLKTLNELANALAAADLGLGSYQLSDGAAVRVYRVPPVFDLSTARVTLADDGSPMVASSLLTLQAPASARYLSLDLDFRATDLEMDILYDPERLGDYLESSWLKFVLPGELAGSDTELGVVQIPVPLRVYPETSVVTRQGYDVPQTEGFGRRRRVSERNDVAIRTWDYESSLRRVFAAQDVQTLRFSYNVPVGPETDAYAASRASSDRDGVFAVLAAWSAVQADVLVDLGPLGDPSEEPTDAVLNALAALDTLSGNLVDAINSPMAAMAVTDGDTPYVFDVRLLPSEAVPTIFDTLVLTFVSGPDQQLFRVERGTAPSEAAHIAAWAPLFAARGRPLTDQAYLVPPHEREDGGDHWLLEDPGNHRTWELRRDETGVSVMDQTVWPLVKVGDGAYEPLLGQGRTRYLAPLELPINQAVEISYKFTDLEVLTHQNALGSSEIVRNASLVAAYPTAVGFVYDTGIANFPAVVTPSITYDGEIVLNDYAPAGTLRAALSGFFEEITAAAAAADPNTFLRMSIVGGFLFDLTLSGQLTRTGPLLLQAPDVQFDVTTDYKDEGETFVDKLATTTEARAAAAGVPDGTGRYQYQLKIFSSRTGVNSAVPLVTYTNLVFVRSAQGA